MKIVRVRSVHISLHRTDRKMCQELQDGPAQPFWEKKKEEACHLTK